MSDATSLFQAAESLLARANQDEWTNDTVNRRGPSGEMVREVLTPGEPCAGLIYDVEAGMARTGLFEEQGHRSSGRTLVISTVWTPADDRYLGPARLREDFYATFGEVFGAQTFVDQHLTQDALVFRVITGNEEHGHMLEFHVIGAAAGEVFRYLAGQRPAHAQSWPTPERTP
jgi:hypothetical protein